MKWRLAAALFALTTIVLLVHDIPLINYLRTVESDRITTALERDAFVIAGRSGESLETSSVASTEYVATAIAKYAQESGARVVVTDPSGLAIATSDEQVDALGSSFVNRPEVLQALGGEVVTGRRYSNTLAGEILYVSVPVLNGTRILGSVLLTFPASTVDDAVNTRMVGIFAVAGITLLITILVALLIAFGITSRLTKLRNVTEEFSRGNLDIRAQINGGAPEIQSLARSFNTMADQLQRLIAQQRAFAGDASHQLRTPLTALQLRLERATEMLSVDPAGAAQRLDAAVVETDRLQRLVEGLLVLSRSEATNIESGLCDLSSLVRQRAENWQALGAEQGVTIDIDVPKNALVKAVPGAIEQIIDNYVDNALEVVPKNSTITISIATDQQYLKLSVVDQGPGMSEADLAKAFNRFWRARSDVRGSGLGLAIVERLAQASGGRAELINLKPSGLSADAYFLKA